MIPGGIFRIFAGLSAALILAVLVLTAVSLSSLGSPIILHVSPSVGVDKTGGVGALLGIEAIGIIMSAVNIALSAVLAERMRKLSCVLGAFGVLAALLTLITGAYIISIN